jgi:glycosyltransferase involved in cell wall biosynthesis
VKELARGNPDIVFEGRFDNARVAEVLQQMDVLVVPSQSYETGPLVTWEAFACGTPVVATDLPNMKYQIQHEVDGLLFAPDDSRALARQLQRLLDVPTQVKELTAHIRPVKSHEDEMREILAAYGRALRVSRDGEEQQSGWLRPRIGGVTMIDEGVTW